MNHLKSSLLTSLQGVSHGFYFKDAVVDSTTPLLLLTQVHSSRVISVSQPLSELPEADGLVTSTPNLTIGVKSADCVPLLLCDPKNRVIGAIHAGWRGALLGVTEKAISVMVDQGAGVEHIKAALGPSIMQSSYEVGLEVYEQFIDQASINGDFFHPSSRLNHFYFDLSSYVSHRLTLLGVSSIHASRINTFKDPRFFSYRETMSHQMGSGKRNNLSLISLDPPT